MRAEAEGLIALVHSNDLHPTIVKAISNYVDSHPIAVLFPLTAMFEAVTALQRKLTKPELAKMLLENVKAGKLPVNYIDESAFTEAVTFFNPLGSKQDTLYDALVAALAKQANGVIFSFDQWYKKQGFMLASDLLQEEKKAA